VTRYRERRDAGEFAPPAVAAADEEGALGAPSSFDSMTKAELLAEAQSRGISPANNDMTKDELRAALEGAE
jgi:hypothetical protein